MTSGPRIRRIHSFPFRTLSSRLSDVPGEPRAADGWPQGLIFRGLPVSPARNPRNGMTRWRFALEGTGSCMNGSGVSTTQTWASRTTLADTIAPVESYNAISPEKA